MSEISVYAFEDEDDESATDWTTDSFREAQEYARENRVAIIERTYEYTDSVLIEDYRPGHALDGTKLDEEDDFDIHDGTPGLPGTPEYPVLESVGIRMTADDYDQLADNETEDEAEYHRLRAKAAKLRKS